MKTFDFWIKRSHASRYERVRVTASDSVEAVNMLPACVTWDFAVND